ncbi:FixH family protein [Aliifodinibius sp. S!AR15-10]|uniref:FixH family protein n=1 Tax=Aliifodinibius sp. S!AR15-10 TaxID=2950437 RepID=UPI002859659E|nr:FixH family protein [Aliifodinibius sp. S!AR15-10]MDR8393426.1 FixH family protein [Aliifodinibius sp. S!AR15-10]
MSNSSNKNEETGFWDWGKGLAIVIALFVITTLSVVFYLVSLDYYMVSENHYEKAVEYQQQIDRIEHARDLEKSVEIGHASQDIRIQFPDSLVALEPVGTVRLYRPSDSNLDRSFKLSLDEKGAQLIPTAELKQGKWLVQITWESDGREYFEEAAVFL